MQVVLYTIHCPKCIVIEKKLNNKNIKYIAIDDENIMAERGIKSSPVLEVGGKLLEFSAANDWINKYNPAD